MFRFLCFFSFLLSVCALDAESEQTPSLQLEEMIKTYMRDWKVPGMSVSIYVDDEVVFENAYGIREIERRSQMTPDSSFAIGDISKCFTVLSLGILVDEGKLSWDDKVIDYLPELELYDPYVTRELTVGDILCQRSGLSNMEALWFGSGLNASTIFNRLRHLPQSQSFRYSFEHDDLLYTVAGLLVARITGERWADFVKARILRTMGLKHTAVGPHDVRYLLDVARPHQEIRGRLRGVLWSGRDGVIPAQGSWSSSRDLIRLTQIWLGNGVVDGERILSEKVVQEILEARVAIPVEHRSFSNLGLSQFEAAGFAWKMRDYQGLKIYWVHGETKEGMDCVVVMVPDQSFSFVLMVNRLVPGFLDHLQMTVIDTVLGLSGEDWNAKGLEALELLRLQEKEKEKSFASSKLLDRPHRLSLENYEGIYESVLLGDLTVRRKGNSLVVELGSQWLGTLEHWHYDTFLVHWKKSLWQELYPRTLLTFHLSDEGQISSVSTGDLGLFDKKETDSLTVDRKY